MKKVLYITYDGLLDPLGSSQILPYVHGLSDKYHFFILSYEKKERIRSAQFNELKKKLNVSGIKHNHLLFAKKKWLPLQILKGYLYSVKLIYQNKISLIHTRSFIPGIVALLLKKTLKIPFIFDMRGLWIDERVDAGVLKNKILYKFLKYLERTVLRNAAHITVLTENLKNMLINRYDLKIPIKVIPTCVDLNRFNSKKPNYDIIKLVYFGSCGPRYNIEEVINFFNQLKKLKRAQLTLIINNPQDLSEDLKKVMENNKDVKIIEKLSREEIVKIIGSFNVSILFLNDKRANLGVCPTRFGESLACGIPAVISKNMGDCYKLIEKNDIGIVVNGFNEKEYFFAIQKLLKLIKGENLAVRCRNVAENNFNLKKGIEEYGNTYQVN